MGIYDNNLKRTNLGYQFDRNVYIGIQTNDNRVVTFKDLSGAVATQIASGGGGEDIQLQLSSITELGSSTNPADHLSFHRDGLPVEYDILPQYVRAAEPEEGLDLNDGKACLLMPVVGDNDEIIGYKLYATDTLSMATLQLVIGSNTYTYDGSAAVEINFGTIPTVAASSRNIVTTIPDSDTSTDIPTAGAVHKFAASAGSLKMTAATSGYLVGVVQQPSATTRTLAPVGSESIKWGATATDVGSATQWLNANITGHLNNDFVINIGGTTYSYNGSSPTTVNLGTIPTVPASSVTIVTDISTTSGAASSTAIPTEGAVYKFAAAAGSVKATASASGYILGTSAPVTATSPSSASALNPVGTNLLQWSTNSTLPTASHWINANITGKLNHSLTINIGSSTKTYNGGNDVELNFNTIPTVPASSVGITTSVSSASSSQIPTEGAVYEAIQRLAPGIGGIATSGTGNAVTSLSYNSTTKTLTVTSGTTFLTTVTGGDAIVVTGTGASRTISLNASFTNAPLAWGAATTYATVNGTTYSITLPTVNTIPTVPASSVGITTSVSSSSSTNIPTEGAVLTAIQNATPNIQPGNNISITTSGSTTTIGLNLITSPVSFGYASGDRVTFDEWGDVHVYGYKTWYILSGGWSDEDKVQHLHLDYNGIVVDSRLLVPTITNSSNNAAAANKSYVDSVRDYVDGIGLTYNSANHLVTFTKADQTTVTFTTASSWNDLNDRPTFNNVTLSWGSAVTYATVSSENKTITLPTVNTIPTVAASSISIINTIPTNPVGAIPTDIAVIEALTRAPGIATVTSTITSSNAGYMVTGVAYNSADHILSYTKTTASISGSTITIGSHSTTWTNTVGLSWNTANHAITATVDSSSAIIPIGSKDQVGLLSIGTYSTTAAAGNHAHATFSVFGQGYTGAAAKTVSAGSGLTVSTSASGATVDLNAEFLSPTLAWGTATKYATVAGTSYSITLPTVNTIPTIAAASIAITTATPSSSSSHLQIPTALAVWQAVSQATGTVSGIKLGNSTTYTPDASGTINLPAYPTVPNAYLTSISNSGNTYTITNSSGSSFSWTIPTTLPASDVADWAKADSAPTYNFSEIYPGSIVVGDGAHSLQWRTTAPYRSGMYYHTAGDESVVFANKYPYAGWIFVNSVDPVDRTDWRSLSPTLQIKRSGVAINKLIGHGAAPAYNLDVNGSANATTLYENGTALTAKYAQKSAFSYNSDTGVLTISLD